MPPEVCVLDEVGMRIKGADLCDYHLDTAASRDFECWYEVRVIRCNNDAIHIFVERQSRYVDADAHVDAFLFKPQFVIFRSGRAELSLSQLTQIGFRKSPAAWMRFPAPKCDEILLSKSVEKCISRFGYWTLRVRDAALCYRMPLHASVWAGIIVKYSPSMRIADFFI